MKKNLLKSALLALMVLVGGNAWAGDKTVVKYSFDDATSPSLTAGSRVGLDYSRTSVISSTTFLNAWNNTNGDPGASTVSLGNTDLSGETWTLSFEWAACGGCNSKADHTTLKAGDTNLFDLTGNSNWNTTVTITYAGSDGTKTLPVPGCDKSKRFTAAVGDQLNTETYWHHIVVTGSASGVTMTITNSSTGTAVVENVMLSETNVNPTSLIIEPCCGGAIGIDELSLTYSVEGEVIQTPTANYTAVNGIERTIAATCDTEGATLYYSTDGENWTEGASVTVSASGNVYFKAVKGNSESDVLTFAAVAGEAITLNAPTIVRSDNTTVTISSDQTNLLLSPTATIKYTYGNETGEFTGSKTLTVAAEATITAYAEATGYTTSATSERAVALFPEYVNTVENTPTVTKGTTTFALSTETITVSEREYAALLLDGVQWGKNVYLQNLSINDPIVWGIRNGNWYINTTDPQWILIRNLKAGDIVVVDVTYPAADMVNATYSEKLSFGTKHAYIVNADGDVELDLRKINAKEMNYFYGVYSYSPMSDEEVAAIEAFQNAKTALAAAIAEAKAIETEGKEGVEALQTAIATAETALAAEDATTESLTAAKKALAEAVAAFEEANKPAFDPATAIVNAGFNPEADPLGWDKVTSGSFFDLGMGLIGTYQVRGEHPAATVDETHLATEFAAGLECRWQTNYAAFTQTTAELPAGAYKLTFDVENTNATTTKANYENRFNVTVGETTYADESTEWMDGKSAWTTHTIAFTLTEASPVTISLGYGTGSNNFGVGNTPALFVSHLTLEAINPIEIALIDLQAAIEAAQAKAATYTVGTEFFTYAESEIKPLNDAIATAQAAYTAAESAEAVKSATETLNAFVATFAPVMNKPAADKEYVITNKNAELALSIGNGAVKIETEGVVKFTEVEGGWVLSNNLETPEYVFKTTGNTWTLSTTANKDEAYVVNFNLADGAYTIQGANGLFGTDNTAAGSTVYANKAQSNNGLWTIAEYVAPEPVKTDYTEYIVNADLTNTETKGWDETGTKNIDGSGIVKVGSAAAFDFKQTIENLPAGKYKVIAQAAYRYGDSEQAEYEAMQTENTITKFVQLYATVGTKTVSTLVQNRYDGASDTDLAGEGAVLVNEKYVPNSSNAVKAWFAAGKYVNELEFNLPADGAVTIGINRVGTPESDYTVIGPWTLTRLGDAEEDVDPLADAKAELNAAIADAKAIETEGKNGVDELNAAIAAAEAAVNAENATAESLAAAKAALAQAIADFEDANRNIPALAGWTKVKSANIENVADNYYVLVDADSYNYVMSNDATHYRPCYKTLADPVANPSFVWTLEGSDNTFALKSFSTGSYFVQANGWDTSMTGAEGTATFQFTLNNGAYTVRCVQSNALVGHWNDNGASVANDGENIAANKQAKDAPGFYLYAISKQTYEEAILAARKEATKDASKENAVDITAWIQNADWSGDFGGWARSGSWGNMQWGQKTLEVWNATNVAVKQTLKAVPDGTYKLTVDVISGNDDNKVATAFAIGGTAVNSDPVTAVASDGNYTTMSNEVAGNTLTADNIIVTGGELTVGLNIPAGWIVADNFKLYFYGEDMSQYVDAYHTALAAAQAIDTTSPMNSEVLATLSSALTTYGTVDETDKAALLAATTALSNAASAANASVAAYAKAKAAIDAAKAEMAATNVYTTEALEAYKAVYDAAEPKYQDGSLTDDEAKALENPTTITGWHDATIVDNFLLSAWDTNPDFQDAPYYINTWSTEGDTDGSDFKVPFFEYWTSDGNSLGEKTLTATMTDLEAGNYEVKAWVRVRIKNGAEAPAAGITFQANDGEAVNAADGAQIGESQFYLKEVVATGTVAEDGVLNIKFNVASENNISWLSFKNVWFEKTEVPAVYEGFVAVSAAMAQAPATPLAPTATEEQTVTIAKGAEENQVNITFTGFHMSPMPSTTGEFTLTATATVGEDGSITYTSEPQTISIQMGQMTASYTATVKGAQVNAEATPVLVLSVKQATIFTVVFAETVDAADAKMADVLKEINTATGINGMKTNAIEGTIYNLNGQKVEKTKKGLYIINGKKVVIK